MIDIHMDLALVYLIRVINLDRHICYLHHFPSLLPTVLSSFESEIKIIFLTSSYQLLSYYLLYAFRPLNISLYISSYLFRLLYI